MKPELYQKLYTEKGLHYGSAARDRCPGVRYLPTYEKWIESPIIDLGCGTGDTVKALRDKGFECDGVDQVRLDNDMIVSDITIPMNLSMYNTALCIDVLEHLDERGIDQVLDNMTQTQRSVISIHTGSSTVHGHELHETQRPIAWWRLRVCVRFDIDTMIVVNRERFVFLLRSRARPRSTRAALLLQKVGQSAPTS